jgi:mannan endo-1,4-beta-mannosidase
MGKQHAIVFSDPHAGIDWLTGSMGNYGAEMTTLWNSGHVPLIGWGSLWPLPAGCSSVNCSGQNIDANIANGMYDAGLDASASALKTWLAGPDGIYGNADDRRVYLRPSQEVNGNFFVWSPNVNGNTVQDYVSAWRHIWTTFMVSHGLDSSHVQWIYCVNNEDFGGGTIESDYPGSSYVDWMGVDGYSSNRFAGEMDPPAIFDSAIGRLQALAPSKPLAINETGYDGVDSCSQSSSLVVCKDTWLSNLYNYVQTKGVRQVEYFNENGYDWMVFGCTNSGNCPDGSGRGTLPDAADGSTTVNGYTYNFYSAYKNAVSSPVFLSTDASNSRLVTDAQFQGH